MKRPVLALLALLAIVLHPGAGRADIASVILSVDGTGPDEKMDKTITLSSAKSVPLVFDTDGMASVLPSPLTVTKCELRIVALLDKADRNENQDFQVLASDSQIGHWSTYYLEPTDNGTPVPLSVELKKESKKDIFEPYPCVSGGNRLKLTLQSNSPLTETKWIYAGGKANVADQRPRLIVTYTSGTIGKPVRPETITDWKYRPASGIFAARLSGQGLTIHTNPVSYKGGIYFFAKTGGGVEILQRIGGAGNLTNLTSKLGLPLDARAFVTGAGRMRIVADTQIASCDLNAAAALPDGAAAPCQDDTETAESTKQIAFETLSPPAMGPDGSLYFKNTKNDGRIDGFNAATRRIWSTKSVWNPLSPIALSEDGRYAFVLGNTDMEGGKKTSLARIDTQTGEVRSGVFTVSTGTPTLTTPFRPIVTTKSETDKNSGEVRITDYVVASGNEGKEAGYLTLIAVPRERWPGELSTEQAWKQGWALKTTPLLDAPVSDPTGTPVFYASRNKDRDGNIYWFFRLDWSDASSEVSPGRIGEFDAQDTTASSLTDGDGSIYLYSKAVIRFDIKRGQYYWLSSWDGIRDLRFTRDGTVIGYDAKAVYDLTPRADLLPVSKFEPKTIESAGTVSIDGEPYDSATVASPVFVRGNNIKLGNHFRWPVGAELHLQSVVTPP